MKTMEAAKCAEALDVMKDWSNFKKTLREGIEAGRRFGMSDQDIQATAVKVGDYLNERICPGTSEEQLLKDMWDVSSVDERKAEASVLYKMITEEKHGESRKCVEGPEVMKDWSSFTKSLKEGIETGRKFGMSEEAIKNMAVRIGDFLNDKICPANSEEQLMKDMWEVSTEEERKAMGSVLYKMLTK